MKIYSSEIADMLVTVVCNGLDNQMGKLPYRFIENKDYSEADVIILFSDKEDKAIEEFLEEIEENGVNAGLIIGIYSKIPEKERDIMDMTVKTEEKCLPQALSSVLSMIDYYNYANYVDIGEELANAGKMTYLSPKNEDNMALIANEAKKGINGAKKAFLLIEVGEDVWMSEIEAMCDEMSESAEEEEVKCFALRTLEGNHIKYTIFKSID